MSRLRDLGPASERLAGAPGVDCLSRRADAVLPILHDAGGAQRGGAVEEQHVAARPIAPAQELARDAGVLLGSTATYRIQRTFLEAKVDRVQPVLLAPPVYLHHVLR